MEPLATVVTEQDTEFKLILASASPRRYELLQQLGVSFRVQVADIDETPRANEAPQFYVQRMAYEKAAAVLAQMAGETVAVLGADTTVVCEDRIFGKPQDEAHFKQIMKLLSGREHQVLTAVSLQTEQRQWQLMSNTSVRFSTLTDAQIQRYWLTQEPRGKAGGYAIQGYAAAFVQAVQGSYSGVVGLPLAETAQLLDLAGILYWRNTNEDSAI